MLPRTPRNLVRKPRMPARRLRMPETVALPS